MASRSFQLKIQAGPDLGKIHYLYHKFETIIGRDEKSDIIIQDATVSRQHASLTLRGNEYVLSDLSSTNGTFVNDGKITTPSPLKEGDVISLGNKIKLVFAVAQNDPQATLHAVNVVDGKIVSLPQTVTQPLSIPQVLRQTESGSVLKGTPTVLSTPPHISTAVVDVEKTLSISEASLPPSSNQGQIPSSGISSLDAFEKVESSVSAGTVMTKQEETILAYNLDEDPEWWFALLFGYIATSGKKSEELKLGMITNSDAWKLYTAEFKGINPIHSLSIIARDKLTRWNIVIKNILADPGHAKLFRMYLQALMSQKLKKVVGFGGRAQLQKQMNIILAVISGNVLANLDKYDESQKCLTSGKASDGSPLSDTLRKFYEPSKTENLRQITLLMAVVIIFKAASCGDDIKKLQDFIRANLVTPMKAEAESLPTGYDKTQANKRLEGYMQLIKTVDISFG